MEEDTNRYKAAILASSSKLAASKSESLLSAVVVVVSLISSLPGGFEAVSTSPVMPSDFTAPGIYLSFLYIYFRSLMYNSRRRSRRGYHFFLLLAPASLRSLLCSSVLSVCRLNSRTADYNGGDRAKLKLWLTPLPRLTKRTRSRPERSVDLLSRSPIYHVYARISSVSTDSSSAAGRVGTGRGMGWKKTPRICRKRFSCHNQRSPSRRT